MSSASRRVPRAAGSVTSGGSSYPPVVGPERSGAEIVTWGEFVETRLLSEYRSAGVPLLRMRPARRRAEHAEPVPLNTILPRGKRGREDARTDSATSPSNSASAFLSEVPRALRERGQSLRLGPRS